jgi:hypothetical protein
VRVTLRHGTKPLEDHDQRFFFQLNSCGYSPYVTSSLTGGWICLLRIRLAFRQVYISYLRACYWNSSFCSIYKSCVSTGFAKEIMSSLRILCYNGSLVTWTIVNLTTATAGYNISAQTTQKTQFFCCCVHAYYGRYLAMVVVYRVTA